MGCCHSTAASVSKSPPSDEETVKEVLSETQAVVNPKPYQSSLPRPQVKRPTDGPFIKIAPLLEVSNRGSGRRKPYAAGAGNEDHSGEICSSVTASTEKMSTSRDDLRERRHRSPAKPTRRRSLSGEVKVEKPFGRSPGAPGSGYPRRRDAGESSGRRSKSPVPKTGQGSARRTGKSLGRVGSGLGERIRRLDDGAAVPSNDPLENPFVSLECFIFI